MKCPYFSKSPENINFSATRERIGEIVQIIETGSLFGDYLIVSLKDFEKIPVCILKKEGWKKKKLSFFFEKEGWKKKILFSDLKGEGWKISYLLLGKDVSVSLRGVFLKIKALN